MHIVFCGAAGTVTGSCHLVEVGGRRILVDCGLYQGGREVEQQNEEPFGFDPREIDAVILTHAHLDHCGRLPLLVRRGFRGRIYATAATYDLARLVLADAAHVMAEDARYESRRAAKRGEPEVFPLFDLVDVFDTIDRFGPKVRYGHGFEPIPGVRATFHDAGHILGSAFVELEIVEDGEVVRVVFSGDLGQPGRPILHDPVPCPPCDVVVTEATYGDREHRSLEESVEELYDAIRKAHRRGGNVLVPTFALERAQELLYFLREGFEQGRLPKGVRVFLDSPMAISATEIFERYPDDFDEDACKVACAGGDPFRFPNLIMTRDTEASKGLARFTSGAVILAGSGMCTGGRIRHHLRRELPRRESAVVFVGFAALGTPARRIIDGARSLRLFGEEVPVRAQIHTVGGFSAHAGQRELLDWWRASGPARTTAIVHAEPAAARAYKARLEGTRVVIPRLFERLKLSGLGRPAAKGK
ncbi:MAG: MBL fold metallo-hydrolase [Deltaproteobacteria bacterium]|nr:MAG: MBL fold metallo-hydrolase [Deltaproteobacteria bacterium]